MKKGTKLLIELGLLTIIVVLAFLVYNSVNKNIQFEKEKNRKQELVVNKLKDVREIQFAYEAKYGKYCGDWDKLIEFCKTDSLSFTRKIGDMEDTVAVAAGLAYEEEIKVPVLEKLIADSVFTENFNLEKLKYLPESDSIFSIKAGSVYVSGSDLPTFEVGAGWNVILLGQDLQLIENAKEDSEKKTQYEGLRVGNVEEASTEGNWE